MYFRSWKKYNFADWAGVQRAGTEEVLPYFGDPKRNINGGEFTFMFGKSFLIRNIFGSDSKLSTYTFDAEVKATETRISNGIS